MKTYRFLLIAIIFSLFLLSNALASHKPGSCAGYCGDQSPDGCWCDIASFLPDINDHCQDIATACPKIYSEATGTTEETSYETPEDYQDKCKQYYGDDICDDSPEDCFDEYQKGTSLEKCDECQTGGYDCQPTSITSPTPTVGSCQGYCGLEDKATSAGCYCDSKCLDMGDCCPNYKDICVEAPITIPQEPRIGTCVNRCGSFSDYAYCQCDSFCLENKDCCEGPNGYQQVCESEYNPFKNCKLVAYPNPALKYTKVRFDIISSKGYKYCKILAVLGVHSCYYNYYQKSSIICTPYKSGFGFVLIATGPDDSCDKDYYEVCAARFTIKSNGSCAGKCGSSAGDCWCDKFSFKNNDYCDDILTSCPEIKLCSGVGEACAESYGDICPDGTFTKCYKKGVCGCVGDGTCCNWGSGSFCNPEC